MQKTDYFILKERYQSVFLKNNIESADFDWICCEITGKKRSLLPFVNFNDDEKLKIENAIEQRLKHIPLGYIFNKTNFYGFDFEVSGDVLIPRIDTEFLVEKLIEEIKTRKTNVSVLDIGTGSGAIAVVVSLLTGVKVTAVEISEKALKVAKNNAIKNNAKIEFIQSNVFENIKNRKFDIIVSNPPYIETAEIEHLDSEVKDFEPKLALDGGADGLEYYKRIISEAKNHLNSNGKVFFEIGYNQGEKVPDLMKNDFKNIEVLKDYDGNDRVVLGEII